jgi:hypothetical protein
MANPFSAEHPENRSVQYFQFKEHDCRYASVQSMLFTFLAEIYCKKVKTLDTPWIFPNISQPDRKHNLLSLKSKFGMIQDILSTPKFPEILWVLINFNQNLPGAQWLLNTFSGLAASIEMRLKVLFVNSTDIPVPSGYFQTVDYPTNPPTEDVCNEQAKVLLEGPIIELISRNPRLHSLQPKIVILLRKSHSDLELHQMLVEWLSFSNPHVVNLGRDDLEGTSLQSRIFNYVLKSKSPILQPENTLKFLQLVTLSFRPLSIAELLSLDMCSAVLNNCIQSLLPGVLTTHGNEVRLGHRNLRHFILSSTQSETGLELVQDQRKAHGQIADLCLNYILSSRDQPFLERHLEGQLEEQAGPEPRLDFLHYAVNYWPLHARRAHGEFVIRSFALQSFLKGDLLLMQWARAHSLFSKTFVCLDLKDVGPLAMCAQYGLEDILRVAMANHTNASWYSRDCSSAVVVAAAAAGGESNIVRFLLTSITYEKEVVGRALLAAFPVENEEAFELLLVRLHQIAPNFDDVSGLFREAATSDQYDFMQRLCILWKFPNGEVRPEADLLQAAGIEENLETMKYLLKHGNQESDLNNCLDWLSILSKHNYVNSSAFLLKELLQESSCNEKSDPDCATSGLPMEEARQKQLAYIQNVLKDAIKCG